MTSDKFINPRSSYQGQVRPENLAFNANLQEFAHRVSHICNLETSGKLKPNEAYNAILELWQTLDASRDGLDVGEHPFQPEDG
ncbi:DUF7219 family protein [Almyronema epifaneia]|uniref:Uncharacterized protein n=1 Tax=Almyronema epifaneia S1 TaxID=2991925 RepID=A0ABW6I9G7_9CYAN